MPRTRDGLSDMDWDKLKVFHAAAEAGSFTHAGEQLGLSQSAVSRQVSALEQELAVSLFHRHARGLILTEQGDLLFRTAHDVFMQLQAARAKLTDSRERPSGELKVTTTPGVGIPWLIPRLGEFTSLYPDIRISLIVTDEELDRLFHAQIVELDAGALRSLLSMPVGLLKALLGLGCRFRKDLVVAIEAVEQGASDRELLLRGRRSDRPLRVTQLCLANERLFERFFGVGGEREQLPAVDPGRLATGRVAQRIVAPQRQVRVL